MLKSQSKLLEMSQVRQQLNEFPEDGESEKRDELSARYGQAGKRVPGGDHYRGHHGKGIDLGKPGTGAAEVRCFYGPAFRGCPGPQGHRRRNAGTPRAFRPGRESVSRLPADGTPGSNTRTWGSGPDSAAGYPLRFPGTLLLPSWGVSQPTVGVGEAVYPVLTSELVVGTPAENAVQAETTGAFSADVLSPSRLQASMFYSREDRARFAGMDAALRDNLSMGLGDALDKEIIAGTNGLLTGTNLADHDATTETLFEHYISQFAYSRVDGRYASMTGDLRIVMGGDTYAHAGGTYRHANADDIALDRLMVLTDGVRVSAHVPDAASNKQVAVIRLGMRMDMVAPIWEGITLVPDEVTKIANGQIVITAVMLHAVKILRAAGFYKQQTQHA